MTKLTYQEKQKAQFDELELKFKSGQKPIVVCDRVKDYVSDPRRSLTTAFFIPPNLNQAIQKQFVKPLRAIDPYQYYLLPESLHINLLILAYNTSPPSFSEDDAQIFKKVLAEILPTCPPITYELRGILIGKNSLAVRCYSGPELGQTVKDLQAKLLSLGYDTSIGQASKEIFFGNVTFCRYTHEPTPDFTAKVAELKNEKIGKLETTEGYLISSSVVFHPSVHKFYATFQIGKNLT